MERLLAINYVVLATERCDYMPFLNLCISIKNKINKKGFQMPYLYAKRDDSWGLSACWILSSKCDIWKAMIHCGRTCVNEGRLVLGMILNINYICVVYPGLKWSTKKKWIRIVFNIFSYMKCCYHAICLVLHACFWCIKEIYFLFIRKFIFQGSGFKMYHIVPIYSICMCNSYFNNNSSN